jgi:hypothetical protein
MRGAQSDQSPRAARASASAASDAAYRPPWWYRGRHLQTLWGPLLRRLPAPRLLRRRLETPDGDFVDLDWLDGGAGPVVVLLHGLEGSSASHYVQGLLGEISAVGWRAVVLNFRSCSGELNRLPRLYHSGDTGDLDWLIGRLANGDLVERAPDTRIGLVGVSLGANVALKWLGEQGADAPQAVAGAVAISTPFDLAACAAVLDRGLSRLLYTTNFLKTMKAKLRAKAGIMADRVDLAAALRSRTFTEYDRRVTAPVHGFADERDYWTRSSSGPYLPRIRRPALLISAANDPFIPADSWPTAAVAESPWLEAAFVRKGGHVGFLEGPSGRRSWAERRAVDFLRPHLSGARR